MRLERAWEQNGAFANEAHSIVLAHRAIELDYVTWWEHGAFCTGRIVVDL